MAAPQDLRGGLGIVPQKKVSYFSDEFRPAIFPSTSSGSTWLRLLDTLLYQCINGADKKTSSR
jgi:hypothetical protein